MLAFCVLVQGLRSGIVTRLRCDRVLYQVQPPPTGKRGRPQKHGSRFAFKEPHSWGAPDEVIELEDPYWGQVHLERWSQLHEKKVPTFRTMSSGPAFTRNGKTTARPLAGLASTPAAPCWTVRHRTNHLARIRQPLAD